LTNAGKRTFGKEILFLGSEGWGVEMVVVSERGSSQKREAVELKLPALCMLSISQVQGNLIRGKRFCLAVLNNRTPKEAY
jgi:hypothetical protein